MRKSTAHSRQSSGARRILGGICALTIGLAAAGAQASVLPFNSTTPFVLNPVLGPYDFDYTLPTDGRLYEWDFAFTSADPNAGLHLWGPNQTDEFLTFKTSGGLTSGFGVDAPGMQFTETQAPGLTSILYRAPTAFDRCATAGLSSINPCAVQFNIWGNAAPMDVWGTAPLLVTTTFAAVPEPAGWVMLLAGFGGLGAMLRRRRSSTPAITLPPHEADHLA